MTDTTAPVRLRPDRADRLEALLAVPSRHLEPVLDVGRAPNGDLLVELPVPAAALAALVQVPGRPLPGEAVTVLAPLAESLAALHAAGWAHAGIGADAVLLDEDGAPYWRGPAAPVPRRRVGEEAFRAATAADIAAFRTLCATLLPAASLPATDDLLGLADALLGVAVPLPVALHPAPAVPAAPALPSRLVPAGQEAVTPTPRGRIAGVRASLSAVRRRIWVAAGAVAVLLVATPLLLPAADGPAAPAVPRTAPTDVPAAPVPTVARTTGPEAAMRALLVARAACLAAGDEGCLDGVVATGAPAHVADVAAIRSGAEAVPVDLDALRIRSASGSAVLADADGTTVLAVREPDGWRLRDVAPPR